MSQWTLYAWELSYFSGKLRGYLRYKGVPFVEKPINAWTLLRTIPRHTGAVVMPVLVSPEGQWLQDTTAIIDTLEQRFGERPVVPQTPRQRLAARLIEVWADEFWIPAGMHYRWSYPENWSLFANDAGGQLLPYAPRPFQRLLARRIAGQLRAYLPGVGVIPEQQALLERWTEQQLDHLETLLQDQPYLLGDAPSLADFAMIGPLYAHLARDPAPKRALIAPRPALRDWIERVHQGVPAAGQWLADDAIAPGLLPLLRSITGEMLPWVQRITAATAAAAETTAPGGRMPRGLSMVTAPMLDGQFRRRATPYTLWMMQRLAAEWASSPATERAQAEAWLAELGAPDALQAGFGPPLQRDALHVRLIDPANPPRTSEAAA